MDHVRQRIERASIRTQVLNVLVIEFVTNYPFKNRSLAVLFYKCKFEAVYD